MKWCRSFKGGKKDLENYNKTASDRQCSSTTEINTPLVEEVSQNDRRACNATLS